MNEKEQSRPITPVQTISQTISREDDEAIFPYKPRGKQPGDRTETVMQQQLRRYEQELERRKRQRQAELKDFKERIVKDEKSI